MDKFTKVFEADMQNSLDNLTEANGTGKPTYRQGARSLFGKNPPAEHLYKNGTHARAGAGKFVKITHAPGVVLPFDLGATGVAIDAYDKTAKAYLGKGGSMKKGKAQGKRSAIEAMKRGAIGGVIPNAATGGMSGGIKGALAGGAFGAVSGGLGHGINQKVGEVAWYRRKARKMGVAESVLEETKVRIKCRQLEEAGMLGAAKGLWAGFKKLKPIKQIGTMGRTVRGIAKSAPAEFGQLKGSMGTADALKKTLTGNAKYFGQQAAANPYGTATLAGGTGLTAWGLKKPKKVQESDMAEMSKDEKMQKMKKEMMAKKKMEMMRKMKNGGMQESVPFFEKLKDKKGKDEGKGGKSEEALAKAKDKVKGKRVKHFAKEDIGTLMRAGGPMVGKKRKSKFAENMERVKNMKDVKEIDKKEYKRRKKAGNTGSRNVHQEVPNDFIKGKRNVDVVVV